MDKPMSTESGSDGVNEQAERRARELCSANAEAHKQLADKISAEQLLVGEQSFVRTVIDAIPGLLFVCDAGGRLVLVNNAMAGFHGLQPEQMIGRHISGFLLNCETVGLQESASLSGKCGPAARAIECCCPADGGGMQWFLMLTSPLALPNGAALVLTVMFEITALKRAGEIRAVQDKLESTGILAGGIAHDFNNLLSIILLNIELAINSTGHESVLHMSAALRSTRAAHDLTSQLITFAQGGAPVRHPVNCSELTRSAILAGMTGCSLPVEFHFPSGLDWVEVDESQISQVFLNVVLNARDSMSSGGTVSVSAENVSVSQGDGLPLSPGRYVRVSIADQGTGIPPEILPRIFDPYFSTKKRGCQQGMGLGLTICYSILKKHGGCITVDSKLGLGSTFHVYLPASENTGRRASADESSAREERWKVLVMDDDAGMRAALSAVLEARGHTVIETGTGDEAIDQFSRACAAGKPFDLAILDLTIRGGKGGVDTIKALAQIDPGVKAIVMSGYSDDPALTHPNRFGFKCSLEKSFDTDHLLNVMREAMDQR